MSNKKGLTIFVDIDGTICDGVYPYYEQALPIPNRIHNLNKMYQKGHTIIFWTARGVGSKKDYSKLTKKQLKQWGCKYHKLIMKGKPLYDVFIDDRCENANILDNGMFI